MYQSPVNLVIAYGDRGRSGADSGVGTSSAPPYTLLDDANTTRRTPASRASVSTLSVPSTFAAFDARGSATERATAPSAPRWKTTSTPATARATTAASATEPRISSAAGSRFSSRPVERSSSTRTVWPSSRRPSTRCDPMKPAPPVTRASMGRRR